MIDIKANYIKQTIININNVIDIKADYIKQIIDIK